MAPATSAAAAAVVASWRIGIAEAGRHDHRLQAARQRPLRDWQRRWLRAPPPVPVRKLPLPLLLRLPAAAAAAAALRELLLLLLQAGVLPLVVLLGGRRRGHRAAAEPKTLLQRLQLPLHCFLLPRHCLRLRRGLLPRPVLRLRQLNVQRRFRAGTAGLKVRAAAAAASCAAAVPPACEAAVAAAAQERACAEARPRLERCQRGDGTGAMQLRRLCLLLLQQLLRRRHRLYVCLQLLGRAGYQAHAGKDLPLCDAKMLSAIWHWKRQAVSNFVAEPTQETSAQRLSLANGGSINTTSTPLQQPEVCWQCNTSELLASGQQAAGG